VEFCANEYTTLKNLKFILTHDLQILEAQVMIEAIFSYPEKLEHS
jgi:hypothetical protein